MDFPQFLLMKFIHVIYKIKLKIYELHGWDVQQYYRHILYKFYEFSMERVVDEIFENNLF